MTGHDGGGGGGGGGGDTMPWSYRREWQSPLHSVDLKPRAEFTHYNWTGLTHFWYCGMARGQTRTPSALGGAAPSFSRIFDTSWCT